MENSRVLLVEDDHSVAEAICDGASESGIVLEHAASIADARRLLARPDRFNAVILDLCLPDGNGVELALSIRNSGVEVPILMVTGQTSVQERIEGLSSGADDYVCKPFSVDELMARLSAVWRRTGGSQRHSFRFEDIELDLVHRVVKRGDLEKTLSAREVDLLAFLMSNAEEVLAKERILKEVWGDEAGSDANVLHVYANYLRNKTEGGKYDRVIHTVRGVGYILSRHHPEDGLADRYHHGDPGI